MAKELEYEIRAGYFNVYNCAMATINTLGVRPKGHKYGYAPPDYCIKNKDALIEEFLQNLGSVGAAGKGYSLLPFYVFHDNVKGDRVNKDNPLTDMSALMAYLFENQKKFGISVTRTPMADNYYHPPKGSHPGRVYVLTPPGHQIFEEGIKVPAEYKDGIKNCLDGFSNRMNPEDVKTLKGLVK